MNRNGSTGEIATAVMHLVPGDASDTAGWRNGDEFAATACASNRVNWRDALAPITAEVLGCLALMPLATAR